MPIAQTTPDRRDFDLPIQLSLWLEVLVTLPIIYGLASLEPVSCQEDIMHNATIAIIVFFSFSILEPEAWAEKKKDLYKTLLIVTSESKVDRKKREKRLRYISFRGWRNHRRLSTAPAHGPYMLCCEYKELRQRTVSDIGDIALGIARAADSQKHQ